MLSPPSKRPDTKRTWLTVAVVCAALLALPILVWLLLPRPGGFFVPPAPAKTAVTEAPEDEPVAPRPRPKPAATTSDDESDEPVSGVVLDADGKPVSGAFIGCDDRDQQLATTTNDDGKFTLAPAAAGCLAVAHHPEHVPSERMALRGGGRNSLRLGAMGGIEGEVMDERAQPIATYVVAIESYVGKGESTQAISAVGTVKNIHDEKGVFSFEKLLPGRYLLSAAAEGRPPVQSASIEVESGRTARRVRIVLPRGAIVSGHVRDASTKKPIAGVTVAIEALTTSGANAIKPVVTDESGAYSMDGAPPGPFSIRVRRDGYRIKTVSGLYTRGPLTQDIELSALGDGGSPADEYAGIGAILAPVGDRVTIGSLVKGSSAREAGLLLGDRILRIDGVDAKGMLIAECVQRIRGPEGTRVSIQVERGEQKLDFVVTRRSFVNE